MVKTNAKVRIKNPDLQEAIEYRKLMEQGVSISLEDISLKTADILVVIQNVIDEEKKEQMDNLNSESRRLK